jgi:diaminohydroxyphosphoribosylaminopyrimidine deaminase / 5-amino-6-(5-phosphoribosylamino)uracil reductase
VGLLSDDSRWIGAALALGGRGRGRTAPNPNIGCVIVNEGRVVGRGWTQDGGRPHAEAMALAQAGEKSRGATLYVTLEPCAHQSARGSACSELIRAAGVARVVAAAQDPDPRTAGQGFNRLRQASVEVLTGVRETEARRSFEGFMSRQHFGRPQVTLKLATSLDGCIALADGSSRWITGEAARAHAHLERSRHEAILVGRGTWEADRPSLDIRLEGLEGRAPRRIVLSSNEVPGAETLDAPGRLKEMAGVDHLLVEGGAGAAAAFLTADLVDRLLLYRAPVIMGGGKPAIGDIGLSDLPSAHGRWRLLDTRMLGSDRLEVYERTR